MKLRIQARAKINWTLDVVGTLPNGYHDLDMLMQSVGLADTLWLEESDRLTLEDAGQGLRTEAGGGEACAAPVPFDENNLVLGGLGHQFDSSKSIAAKVLWATISGGHQSWTHTGTTAKAEDHNVNKSRTIRCIKTSPAFIIEE